MKAGNLQQARDYLKAEFLREAKVLDQERGYITVSPFNLRMKPEVLKAAACVIADFFKDEHIDIVHGIPHSGNYLATAVALKIGGNVRLHSSRKDQNIPTAWKDVYREEVESFTTSSGHFRVFSGINLSFVQKGDRVLLLDDVCATGETGYRITRGLQKRGVTVVGFAVLFDKVFQGGLDYVARTGIKVFSCVRVAAISKYDRMELLVI